jgi:mannose-6-phosphate isomerase-like protein (cupin superfamily)
MSMIVREVSDRALERAYGTLFQQIYPQGGEELADWGVGRAVVEPRSQTAPHSHDEHELFIVTAGTGAMSIGDETRQVSAGQAVLIPAGSTHSFANEESADRLEFFNVYWPAAYGDVDL